MLVVVLYVAYIIGNGRYSDGRLAFTAILRYWPPLGRPEYWPLHLGGSQTVHRDRK